MIESTIPGVRYLGHQRHADARGSFREIWRASRLGPIDGTIALLGGVSGIEASFVQANVSSSAQGVLRGLHFHQRQLDYWTVGRGIGFVALVDVRPLLMGPGGAPIVETRILETDASVVIPSGVAHGFLALEPLELLYLVTNEFDGSDELGFAWDDPTVAVSWPPVDTPDGRPILSDRDRSNPPLATLVAGLRDGDRGRAPG